MKGTLSLMQRADHRRRHLPVHGWRCAAAVDVASIESYGARLGDADHWRPYAEGALMESGLPEQPMSSGFEGRYPMLVGSQLIVKLFGYFPGWRESFAAELAANYAVEKIDGVSIPRVVASGSLFHGLDEDRPFLIMERLDGRAWREAALEVSAAGAKSTSVLFGLIPSASALPGAVNRGIRSTSARPLPRSR
jgi:hypothetical protein